MFNLMDVSTSYCQGRRAESTLRFLHPHSQFILTTVTKRWKYWLTDIVEHYNNKIKFLIKRQCGLGRPSILAVVLALTIFFVLQVVASKISFDLVKLSLTGSLIQCK